PAGQTPRLLINLHEGNGDTAYETSLTKVDDYTIEGYRFSSGWSRHKVYFCLRTEQPIASIALFEGDAPAADKSETITGRGVKGVVTFADDPTQVALRVAISSVSCQNARLNMDAETDGFQFAKVERQATDKWNRRLSQIKVEGGDPRTEKIFYTALYHAMIAPTIYCDVNGQYRGIDDKVRTADGWTNYSCFSLWDTYRTLNPLLTILSPSMVNDIVRSFLSIYDEQGKLPIWTLVGGETNCMPGYSSVPIIADAYLKGIRGYDAGKALDAMIATATNPAQNGVPYLLEKGYIPCDKVHEATSIALEYAADDWGTALMAKEMGRTDLYEEYMRRGHAYETYFDRTLNYIRPKMDDGSWRTPYDPFKSVHSVGDFTEGTGWQYTFFVPQHPEGLIALMGGDDAFVTKLDSLFSVEGDMGAEASSDISGLIGQYAHGNEPSHHVAYLYPYAGQQWKTAEKVRYIDREFYTDSPDGIIGNEDCGQMSAWYIMSAMGFYQVNPSNGVFVFGSPLFPSLTLRLENGRSFTVTAEGYSDTNIYIQSATLNGQPYEKSYITYDDIMAGGELHFVMGDKPNKSFGAAPESRPVSAQ
ncbi:MAG: sugar hydrolase, partial [Bacteroidales bacterium 55_9]